MSDTQPDIEILEIELPPPPRGAPPHFRELLALSLKTTDSTTLDAAELDYRGVFASADAFIRNQVGEHLPSHLSRRAGRTVIARGLRRLLASADTHR